MAVGVLLLLLLPASRHGLTWDETTYTTTATFYRAGDWFPPFWREHDRHPPLAKYLVMAGQRLQPTGSFLLDLRAGQLLTAALFAGCFFQILHRAVRARDALLGVLILFTVPQVLFHCTIATTDGLLAICLFLLGAAVTAPFAPRRQWLVCGALLALAFLTKYSAVLILPPLLTFTLSRREQPRRHLLALLAALAVAVVLFCLLNRTLWSAAPVNRLLTTVRVLTEYPFAGNRVLFQGVVYGARETPATSTSP